MTQASLKDSRRATRSGRVRLPPVLAGLVVAFLGNVAATEYIASALSYQAALGDPWLHVGRTAIYQPFAWATWLIAFRNITHPVLAAAFQGGGICLFVGFALGVIVAAIYRHFLTRDLQVENPDLHGSAHFMSADQVKASGLYRSGSGVYIGGWTDPKTKSVEYLRHDGPEHIIAWAPTRSGKGVGLVMPTLLSWPHSIAVHDIKGEAWALTAGWRRTHANNHTLRFAPTEADGSCGFNPLEEVRIYTKREVADAQNIAQMIADPEGKGLADHWAKTGHELLSAGILHVLYAEKNKTLRGLVSFFCDPTRPIEEVANAMLTTQHDVDGSQGWLDPITGEPTRVHPMIAESARSFLNKSENERSGVQSTAMSFLTLYRDPIVEGNTAHSDFKIDDLMNDERPVSLYIVVPPADLDRMRPLVRLLINQIVRGLTEKMEFDGGRSVASYRHRLLLLIDEFPSLGKLDIFESALAFIAGYGLKAYLIAQDQAQLLKFYGDRESITSNCHIRVAYAPNKIETAEMLSKMLGTSTVVKQTYSYSGRRTKSTLDQISTQLQEVSRPLMTPDEVMRLPGPKKNAEGSITGAGDMLVFVAGQAPIYGTQILYFRDPTFDARSKIRAPAVSDRIRLLGPGTPAIPRAATAPTVAVPPTPIADPSEDEPWEHPPLDDAALIPDDDTEPSAGDGTFIIQDEGDLELGGELILGPDDVPPPEEIDVPSVAANEPRVASPSVDPYLAASLDFAAGNGSAGGAQPAAMDPYLAASIEFADSDGSASEDEPYDPFADLMRMAATADDTTGQGA